MVLLGSRLVWFPLKLSMGLVFTSMIASCGGSSQTLDLEFSKRGQTPNTANAEFDPNVSGNYVAFVSDRNSSQDVYLYSITDEALIDLPGLNSLDTMASHPTVSEDGESIAFTGTRQGRANIYLYNRETRSLRNLTDNLSAQVRHPTISADGSTIAFEANPDGNWDIKIYNRSGESINN